MVQLEQEAELEREAVLEREAGLEQPGALRAEVERKLPLLE